MGITDRLPRSTYYDNHYRQTAALIRARRQYLVKNIFTGLGLFAFTMGVYSYTIKAISQDDFSDVVPPPIEDKPIERTVQASGRAVERTAAAPESSSTQTVQGSSWRPSWLRW